MKLLKLIVEPKSSFVSYPKADTIFGHFAYHLFLDKNDVLQDYLEEKPKIIFSDFLPDGYVSKPTLPLNFFSVSDSDKKEFRKKQWISFANLQKGNLQECENLEFFSKKTVVRNSINRNTYTTDDSGVFAPYGVEELEFRRIISLYVLFDEESFSVGEIEQRLNKMGKYGFGKKSSTGKGQFQVKIDENFRGFSDVKSNYYLTLSPSFLNNKADNITKAYYDTFNRFGKFANSSTPFKKPVLMAQSGAVVKLKEKKEYIGKAMNNGYDKVSFVQGYSIVVPFQFEE